MLLNPLAVIPTYISVGEHQKTLWKAVESLHNTAPDCDIMIVDDGSPMPGLEHFLKRLSTSFPIQIVRMPSNEGFSRTVNFGMVRAYMERRPAVVLVNQDIQFLSRGWLEAAMADPAGVVGGKLLYPNLLIQHGGIYFSLLHQYFDHLFKFAPFNLPETAHRWVVPVTGALQVIKWETMHKIGFYDPMYRISYEDVDYCIRAFLAGIDCAMNPALTAIHHEGIVRHKARTPKMQQWLDESHARLPQKFAHVNLRRFAHPVDRSEFTRADQQDSAASLATERQ